MYMYTIISIILALSRWHLEYEKINMPLNSLFYTRMNLCLIHTFLSRNVSYFLLLRLPEIVNKAVRCNSAASSPKRHGDSSSLAGIRHTLLTECAFYQIKF